MRKSIIVLFAGSTIGSPTYGNLAVERPGGYNSESSAILSNSVVLAPSMTGSSLETSTPSTILFVPEASTEYPKSVESPSVITGSPVVESTSLSGPIRPSVSFIGSPPAFTGSSITVLPFISAPSLFPSIITGSPISASPVSTGSSYDAPIVSGPQIDPPVESTNSPVSLAPISLTNVVKAPADSTSSCESETPTAAPFLSPAVPQFSLSSSESPFIPATSLTPELPLTPSETLSSSYQDAPAVTSVPPAQSESPISAIGQPPAYTDATASPQAPSSDCDEETAASPESPPAAPESSVPVPILPTTPLAPIATVTDSPVSPALPPVEDNYGDDECYDEPPVSDAAPAAPLSSSDIALPASSSELVSPVSSSIAVLPISSSMAVVPVPALVPVSTVTAPYYTAPPALQTDNAAQRGAVAMNAVAGIVGMVGIALAA